MRLLGLLLLVVVLAAPAGEPGALATGGVNALGAVPLSGLTPAARRAQQPPVLKFPRPKITAPDEKTAETISARTEKLGKAIERLVKLGVRDPALADVEVYLKAAQWIVKHGEFYGAKAAEWTVNVLDRGLLRASQQSRGETPWLNLTGQSVTRGYRSPIDGSVQPFAVTYPHDYGSDATKRYRLDVVLHGRDSGLTEVSFLHRHDNSKPASKDLAHVRIDIYGRGNNAYRWAGEADVWEATNHFLAVENMLGRIKFIDTTKVVLRGFSMGGAGTWHLGLHRPDQFCVIGPGAGFTSTIGYVRGIEKDLTAYQKKCLHIYDAVDYAENAFDVPVVAYSGAEDPQIKAARNIEERLAKLGLSRYMKHLVAPELKHAFPEEWQQKAEAEYARYAQKDRSEYPRKVRFVTWTLRYSDCYWVHILGLDRHYDRAAVEAEKTDDGFTVTTSNVRQLRLALWPGATREPIQATIDGTKLENVRPYLSRSADLQLYLEKREGKWASVLPERMQVDRLRSPRKSPGLQGPIDDAFNAPFLCVRGTGQAWNQSVAEYAAASLERFRDEWSKYFRGNLPIKDDTEVTAEEMATRHLILFGDPGSNSLIREALPRLPLQWTKEKIVWRTGKEEKDYAASSHVPVLIYPSPLATDRYIVINSGHTFHAADFEDTNAMLYPRLGDRALLKLGGEKKAPLAVEVQEAGLFDDEWGPQ
jgi:dienelactone hydrolase